MPDIVSQAHIAQQSADAKGSQSQQPNIPFSKAFPVIHFAG